MDCGPPGSFVRGILQARILGGLPFPTPGYPDPGIEPGSPALKRFLCSLSHLAAAAAKSLQSCPTLCDAIDMRLGHKVSAQQMTALNTQVLSCFRNRDTAPMQSLWVVSSSSANSLSHISHSP